MYSRCSFCGSREFIHDGESVNLWLVRSGLAWPYLEFSDSEALVEAERLARLDRVGLWSDSCEPTAQWDRQKLSKEEPDKLR